MTLLRHWNEKLWGTGSFAVMARVVLIRGVSLGINVLTGLLTAALLGPAGRGEQAAMVVAPQFLAGLASLGLHVALIFAMKTDPAREREYLGANLLLTSLAAAAMAVLGWFALPWWLHDFAPRVLTIARMLICITPMLAMSWCFNAAAEARGWFGFANLVTNLQSLLILSALLLAVALHRLDPYVSACIYILSNIPIFLVLAVRVTRDVRPIFTLRREISGKLLRFGLRFYGTDLLGTLSGYVDQIVIMPILPPATIGVYVVARSLSRTLGVLSDAVASVLFPSIAGKPAPEVVRLVLRTGRITVLINVAVALLLGALAPILLATVYGHRFVAAAAPLRILLAATIFFNAARILYQGYNACDRPEIVTAVEVTGTIAGVALTLLLVPVLGVSGAAWAILAAGMLRLAGAAGLLRRVLRVGWSISAARAADIVSLPVEGDPDGGPPAIEAHQTAA